ncbi:MAG: SDR family NAD(P)-dependent oxidoreductase [Legionellales bacterium]|nr:SDR family NAD(P)-dependent oxidoreductase [Legionellales bacterium]
MNTSQHLLITGASGGLGSALALAYAKVGVRLSLFGRQESALAEIAAACRVLGAEVVVYSLDLCRKEALRKQIEWIDDKYPIDLVIANAGIATYLDEKVTLESWEDTERTIDVNLTGAMGTAMALIPRMRARKQGQIAFVSSVAAYHGLEICPSYCASKAGVKAYGESLRRLLKKDGIGVSVICPGFIESGMSQKYHARKHGMLTPEAAAIKIKRGLEKNKENITFPFFLGLAMRLLTILPSEVSEFFITICL